MTTTTTRKQYEFSDPDENGELTVIAETETQESMSEETDSERDLNVAHAEEARAKAAAALAQAEAFRVEARKHTAEAASAEITLHKAQRNEREELAADKHNHVLYLNGGVDGNSVQKCLDQLNLWSRTEDPQKVELVIFSPGGSVMHGMALFDVIMAMRSNGWHFTTVARGYAASMGGILLQAGDVRVCGPESYILIHEISSGAVGKIGELEDEVEFVRMIQERVLEIFVARSNGKVTKAKLRAMFRRKDFWLDSDKALKLGIVDEVR